MMVYHVEEKERQAKKNKKYFSKKLA